MSNDDGRYNADLGRFMDKALADSMKPCELESARRESMRENIMSHARNAAPPGTRTIRAHEGEWQEIAPLILMKRLRHDLERGNETNLFRLQPGAVFPAHVHRHEEECLVLEGEIEFDGHVIRAGDMHIAEMEYEHPAMTSKTGALLLLRSHINEFSTDL